MNDPLVERLSALFSKDGLKTTREAIIPELGWGFDLFAENKSTAVGVEIRQNETISALFVDKIKLIKKYYKKLTVYVAFRKNPGTKTVAILKSIGVGIIIFEKGQLFFLQKSRDFSARVKAPVPTPTAPKDMSQIWVFPSSHNKEKDGSNRPFKERQIICRLIKRVRDSHDVPVHANLVEEDPNGGANFRKKEIEKINQSRLFIAVIKDPFSKEVDFEVRHALETKSGAVCLIFKHERTHFPDDPPEDKKQVALIEFVKGKNIQYLSYSRYADFSRQLEKNFYPLISLVFKKAGFPSPFQRT